MNRASLAVLLAEERSILAELAAVRKEIEARGRTLGAPSIRLVPDLGDSTSSRSRGGLGGPAAAKPRSVATETRSEFLEVTR